MFLACERQTFLLAHRRRPSAVMNEKNVFRSQASMFPQPEKLQNRSNEGKGKEKKKERGEVKGGEVKKAMVALLVFIIATLEKKLFDAKGQFVDNVIKNPARRRTSC